MNNGNKNISKLISIRIFIRNWLRGGHVKNRWISFFNTPEKFFLMCLNTPGGLKFSVCGGIYTPPPKKKANSSISRWRLKPPRGQDLCKNVGYRTISQFQPDLNRFKSRQRAGSVEMFLNTVPATALKDAISIVSGQADHAQPLQVGGGDPAQPGPATIPPATVQLRSILRSRQRHHRLNCTSL